MKLLRLTLAVLACVAAPVCLAQWQWLEKDGRKVFSDQPPPSSIPDKSILRRPGPRQAADAAPSPLEPQTRIVEAAAVAAPKVSGTDKELEARRKRVQAAEAEKKQAQDEEIARFRAENCERVKRSKQLLDSGSRLVTTNAKGEREVMDDAARLVEGKRLDGVIARDCKAA